MISLRRAAVVLASTGLLACFGDAAPPAAPTVQPPDAAAEERFRLEVDSRLAAKLDAARDAVKAEDWDKAAALLQELLDLDEDRMAEVGGDKHPRLVGVRAEAGRLVAGLPAAGKKAYQAVQGPRAADLLKEGIKDKDETKIAEVVRRFLNTDAGPEALEALAGLHYDAGRNHFAALCYGRLLGLRDAAKWAPGTLFRAADAFHRVGDKERAELAAKRLLERLGGDGLRFGDRKLDRDEVRKELDEPAEANGDWPMFGGDAGRSAQGEGGMPFLRYDWEVSTVVPFGGDLRSGSMTFKEKVETLFKTASDCLSLVNQPVLPPQFPVTAAVTLKSDGKKHSLVVFRTHSGIAACDMTRKNGKLVGRNPIRGTLEWMMADGRENTLNQWMQAYFGVGGQGDQRPGILFENTTIGTLSTDGEFAYTVEDLAVPPPPSLHDKKGLRAILAGSNPYGWPQDLVDAVNHSRLMAYDLTRGCALAWAAPDDNDKTGELTDSYFLGPPLPLDGRLFVLNEKKKSLRLVCLETVMESKGVYKPHISFVLPLGEAPSALGDDPLRRVHAALLAYGEGVIVCPTDLGCVVGVDLLTRDVAWVHRYEAPKPAPAPAPAGGRFVWPGVVLAAAPPQSEWRNLAPVVSAGAVIVAPPDGDSLSCLDLKTGEMKWKEPRQEGDLYLAGAFDGRVLVVGDKACRAYALSDGKLLWTLHAGVPSGQGAAAGGVYYLPLREAVVGKGPEVCAIDLAKGKIFAHAPLNAAGIDRKTDALGNLLFSDGVMISQTTTEVAAYPLLKAKLEQMDRALAKNPDDPGGLYSRAELRFEQGDSVGAIDDLRKAIDGKPPAELLARARRKLYEVLTQLLQNDFPKGEKYLKEYEGLSKAGADDAEAHRRRAVYYLLTGRGYAAQGRPLEALKAYEELGNFGDDPLPSPDDAALRVSPAAWAMAHIAELLQKATPDQRKRLQQEIDRRLKGAKDSASVGELQAFVMLFDSPTAAGRDARLELAERLIDEKGRGREVEVLLTDVAQHEDDPVTAGRAVEALARLSTRLGLLEDALYYYGALNRDYATIKVRDGRTGADFFKEVAADKRFLPFLGDKPAPFEKGRLRAKGEIGAFPYADPTFLFTHEGKPLPFFRRYRLGLEFEKHELALLDRASGEPRGQPIKVMETPFLSLATYSPDAPDPRRPIFPGMALPKPTATPLFPYQTVGRLAVVPVGPMVFGLDAVEGKLLWQKNVSERANQPAPAAPWPPAAEPRDGDLLATYLDGWLQRIGPGAEVLTPSAFCLMTRDGLTAIDPPTGRMLWQRNDVADSARLFGDDAHLFVVETKNGRMERTRVFRTADGSDLSAPDFRAVYEKRQQVVGCDLLTADSDKAGLTLRLYDPLTGKDLWKETYPAGSLPLTSLAPDLTGAVEPKGKLHVVDLRSLKEVFGAAVNPKYLDKVDSVYLLDDGKRFYVVCNAALADNVRVTSDLLPGTGLRDLPVNGEVYAFNAAGGKQWWHIACPNQRLLLDGFAESPAVVFAARQLRFHAPFDGATDERTALRVMEKRSGKLLMERDKSGGEPIHTISVDSAKGRIEITTPKERIVITAEDK